MIKKKEEAARQKEARAQTKLINSIRKKEEKVLHRAVLQTLLELTTWLATQLTK